MSKTGSAIQSELQQRKTFTSRKEEAMLGLLKTADVVRRVIVDVLEPYDVTPQQYNVLRILRGAGRKGIPTLSIRDRMIEQAPGVTRLIDRLVERGWAERRRCAEDRRQVFCHITRAGLDLLARLDEPIEASHDAAMIGLDDAELGRLIELLDRVRAAHRAAAPDCPPDPQTNPSEGEEHHA